ARLHSRSRQSRAPQPRVQGPHAKLLRRAVSQPLHLGRHGRHARQSRRGADAVSDAPAARIPPQPWMEAADARAVVAALGGGRFVGGCVRDALLGRAVGDIDIATPLTPEEVTRRLTANAIKVVPTGLAHGTVTAVMAGRPFEITTLRRDVETDGR